MTSPFVPFTLAWDHQVPIDISFVFADEKPAGKHGFLTAKGDRFVFEDGTEGRFWGTCFNSGACFPEHGYSEMVAKRLAKFGVNMVRTHQMDAEWATPNIFQFNRACPKDNTRSLDVESLDRLDFLFYCLKREGIYIYLDMLTYRQFRPGDGVDNVDNLKQAAKSYDYFDPRLVELQKEFNAQLWNHVNPYTGLAYKEDPAIALSEVVNESDPFMQPPVLEPYRSRLEVDYRKWCEVNHLAAEDEVDFAHPNEKNANFFKTVMEDHYHDIIAHLRSLGVKVPVNGTNWSINLAVSLAQKTADFSDSHCYWNFPLWEDQPGTATTPMVRAVDNTFGNLTLMRLHDRPFFLSEWDHAWPDEWRAESPLAYAALAAHQGWSGATIHTYRYSTWGPVDRLGGGASTINGITYRNHFDAFNDPAKFGLFHHAALILRRGDVRQAEQTRIIQAENDDKDALLRQARNIPALRLTAEINRVGIALPEEDISPQHKISLDHVSVDPQAGEVRSDTGQLYRSWEKGYATIDTPRSKAAYGFLGGLGKINLDGLELEVQTDFAVIALSSLNSAPISESDSILLTAVGRCDNSGSQYDEDHRQQLDFGHAPMLIQVIEAHLKLYTQLPNLKVWVISEHGEAVTRLPVVYQDNTLSFSIGAQHRWNPSTMYYLIKI